MAGACNWYGLVLQYQPDELGGLPAGRYHEALLAEGCTEAGRPSSTCPLNLLPLFQDPGELSPAHKGTFACRPGDFPRAEAFHAGAIKLPVWHREQDMPSPGSTPTRSAKSRPDRIGLLWDQGRRCWCCGLTRGTVIL